MSVVRHYVQVLYTSSVVRFICVGAANTLLDFTVFFLLYLQVGTSLVFANSIAFAMSATQSYLLNKHWSFIRPAQARFVWREYGFFMLISLVSLSLSTTILVVGEPYVPVFVLKCIAALFVPVVNYLSYRYLVFRPSRVLGTHTDLP